MKSFNKEKCDEYEKLANEQIQKVQHCYFNF